MKKTIITLILCVCVTASMAQAKESIYDALDTIKKELNLTPEQINPVKNIISESLAKRRQYLESIRGELVVNKTTLRSRLRKLRDEENEELKKILSPEQMDKLLAKQALKDSLNRDQVFTPESASDDVTMTPEGASMQF